MQEEQMRELYWQNVRLIDSVEELIDVNRRSNVLLQTTWIRTVLNELKASLELISVCYDALQEAGLSWSISDIMNIMLRLEEAQTAGDWVMLGDLYEVQLRPLILDLQCILQSMPVSYAYPDWLQNNLDALKDKSPELYQALVNYNENSGGDYYKNTIHEVEVSQQGYYTLALTEGERTWGLCSNYMPMREARSFINRVYKEKCEQYLVFGWGMGYHVRALLDKNSDLDIVVYEPDLDILYCAFSYTDCTSILSKVRVVWDKEWTQLSELMQNRELILFRPELRNIPIPSIQKQMRMIAQRQDSIDEFQNVFYLNARENIRSCTYYVDDLRTRFEGKRIVIVAAGPSLDRNVEELRQRPEDVVLLAVGTVYRLMVQRRILPDYVIVSDCYISHQILGVEAQVPILLLATADRRIVKSYTGHTYLICQKGYDMSAKYAEEQEYQTYDSGGSVATLALDVAIRMKAASIAFVGLDLAYYENRAHASGTGKETYGGFEFQQVEGIHGELLNSSQAFVNYRTWMERRITCEDVTMPVIDATEAGAKKQGFQIMTLKQYLHQ